MKQQDEFAWKYYASDSFAITTRNLLASNWLLIAVHESTCCGVKWEHTLSETRREYVNNLLYISLLMIINWYFFFWKVDNRRRPEYLFAKSIYTIATHQQSTFRMNILFVFFISGCVFLVFSSVTVSMFSWPMPFYFFRFKSNEIHRLEETQTSHNHCRRRRRQALSRSIVISMKIYIHYNHVFYHCHYQLVENNWDCLWFYSIPDLFFFSVLSTSLSIFLSLTRYRKLQITW